LKIITLATVAVLLMATIGIVTYNNFRADQVRAEARAGIGPEQETYYTETVMSKLPPVPPGIDSVTGRPTIASQSTQTAQGQSYETPTPGTEKNYPYLGDIPTGLEGKIQFSFNVQYNPNEPGRYIVNMKCTNLTVQTIGEVFISIYQIDAGKETLAGKVGVNGLLPGSWYPGLGGWADSPSTKVVARITHVKL